MELINKMLDTVGDFWNTISGANSAMKKQQEFNANEAQKQRDWETEMSNSAYQRTVKDMQQAGLNPYLAIGNGGASTPQGASANSGLTQSNPGTAIGSVLNGIGEIVKSSALMTKYMNDKNEIKPKLKLYKANENLINSSLNLSKKVNYKELHNFVEKLKEKKKPFVFDDGSYYENGELKYS